jgi:hypothetical protein
MKIDATTIYSWRSNSIKSQKAFQTHELEYEGPYAITQVNDNGTIQFQKGIINDVVNICRIKPFYD